MKTTLILRATHPKLLFKDLSLCLSITQPKTIFLCVKILVILEVIFKIDYIVFTLWTWVILVHWKMFKLKKIFSQEFFSLNFFRSTSRYTFYRTPVKIILDINISKLYSMIARGPVIYAKNKDIFLDIWSQDVPLI